MVLAPSSEVSAQTFAFTENTVRPSLSSTTCAVVVIIITAFGPSQSMLIWVSHPLDISLGSTVVFSFNMYDFALTAVLLKFIWMRAVFNKLVRALFPRVAAISPAVAHCKISCHDYYDDDDDHDDNNDDDDDDDDDD